jgi:hypothetical protein
MLVFGCFILIVSMTISNQAFLGGSISWLKWPSGDKVIVYVYDYFAIIFHFPLASSAADRGFEPRSGQTKD